LGLDYFEARYFSSAQGRFTGPDPYNIITEAEDRKHFDTYISQPQNWNRYAYVWNNPLRYVDPHGETVYVVGYTSGNPDGGDDEFKKAALTLANQIMSKKGFDPRKDIVLVQAVSTKDDFKALLKDANSLESRFGKIGSLSLFSHGGPLDGPRFARNSPGATEKDWQFYGGESELRGLKINWEQGAQANFFGCNTAVSVAQRFANAQGTPTWGFNTSSSFSGDPNGKSKMYMLQPWNPNLYMTGRDGRSMVKRDPQQPKR
jgi:RHS repeat-associated protein